MSGGAFRPRASNGSGAPALLSPCANGSAHHPFRSLLQLPWLRMCFSPILTSPLHSDFGSLLGPETAVLAKGLREKRQSRHRRVLLTAVPAAACRALLCCSNSLTVIFTLTPWYTLGFPERICGRALYKMGDFQSTQHTQHVLSTLRAGSAQS